MSTKIPFKVSARTARLIGRENVATPKGAIVELVKNGYDADSKWVVILIDNLHGVYNSSISQDEYEYLLNAGADNELLNTIYEKRDVSYVEVPDVNSDARLELIDFLKSLSVLYIIDAGEGMTRSIIENFWMTIGTDNKSSDFKTKNGRIKAGAKGIGRFALDKLGEKCEMITVFDPEVHSDSDRGQSVYTGYRWNVNWNDFEGNSKTIDAVEAELEGLSGKTYSDYIEELFERFPGLPLFNSQIGSKHGTILKISNLRDIWDEDAINDLYEDLGNLVPPSDYNDFSIKLYSTKFTDRYGDVESAFCDDFDYKIEAHADNEQNVLIRVFRQEYDVDAMPQTFFERPDMKKDIFSKETFEKGYWDTTRTFAQLIPGFKDSDILNVFNKVGPFDFTFYFLKRTTTKADEVRFCYPHRAYNLRGEWLNKFGGIKLFRDGFRVRPYGERNDSAFDWLGLGARKQKSPAGIAKENGGYKVEVENVAGSIYISRLTNISFEDKSSREGLQEDKVFAVFKKIIQGIISIFETDRAIIARNLKSDFEMRNGAARDRAKAEQLVRKILAQPEDAKNESKKEDENAYSMKLLASLSEEQSSEIEQLKEEQKVLRALASSGLMLASFSHDLSKLNISMNNRYEKIKSLLLTEISEDVSAGRAPRKNPFVILERAQRTDEKMQNWLNFATAIIKKDKRKRKDIKLLSYFDSLKFTWLPVFEERGIKLNTDNVDDIRIRAFEIDLDSIFYNLFSNSIDAFIRLREDRERKIDVSFYKADDGLVCKYFDNGPGLSSDIVNPEIIFTPLFTTKRNASTGEEIGTGLGMWILKLIAEDNDAKVSLLSPEVGFGIQIVFPSKYNYVK